MRLFSIILLFILSTTVMLYGQKYDFIGTQVSQTLKFKLINNLIILPVEVNGTELTFILDSGVRSPVIFNMTSSDSLVFRDLNKVKIRGLGEGTSVGALSSKNNRIRFGNIVGNQQILYIIYNDKLDLSGKLGIAINGIIGYDMLKDFVVTINYFTKRITFTKPEEYVYKKCNRCETFDLFFYKNKPYINGQIEVEIPNQRIIQVQLLVDSGGTDSLWLFEDDEKGISIPENAFEDFIGEGISGSIFGMRSRIKSFRLKRFVIKNPNVAYLDSASTVYARGLVSRNGSLGGEILKRFKVIFDYPNAKMTLRKNSNFKDEFNYNMSGIELVHGGKTLVKEMNRTSFSVSGNLENANNNTIVFNYSYQFSFKPIYKIAYIRKNSPAEIAGLLVGDQLIKINGRQAYNYDLREIVQNFYSKDNKIMKLTIDRDGRTLEFSFKLKNQLN